MYQHILVPLDSSGNAERALREAIRLAAEQKARLRLLHVMENFFITGEVAAPVSFDDLRRSVREHGEAVLARAKARAADAGVEADTQLREITEGRISSAIVEEARTAGCDLIVMGTHGRRGFSRFWLGSDAEMAVRTSPVPVLLVRQEEP